MSEGYSNLANYELQTELKRRGLHVTGIRVDLIQRLVRDDARVLQRNAGRRTSDPGLRGDKAIKKEAPQDDILPDQSAHAPNRGNSYQREKSSGPRASSTRQHEDDENELFVSDSPDKNRAPPSSRTPKKHSQGQASNSAPKSNKRHESEATPSRSSQTSKPKSAATTSPVYDTPQRNISSTPRPPNSARPLNTSRLPSASQPLSTSTTKANAALPVSMSPVTPSRPPRRENLCQSAGTNQRPRTPSGKKPAKRVPSGPPSKPTEAKDFSLRNVFISQAPPAPGDTRPVNPRRDSGVLGRDWIVVEPRFSPKRVASTGNLNQASRGLENPFSASAASTMPENPNALERRFTLPKREGATKQTYGQTAKAHYARKERNRSKSEATGPLKSRSENIVNDSTGTPGKHRRSPISPDEEKKKARGQEHTPKP